jgi:uncharacterized membrane protein YebE (DUF533 family)
MDDSILEEEEEEDMDSMVLATAVDCSVDAEERKALDEDVEELATCSKEDVSSRLPETAFKHGRKN